MSLLDAVIAAGPIPPGDAAQPLKKRYSEKLSKGLEIEVAGGLRSVGFPRVMPVQGGPGLRTFQGGLGPKNLDVTYSDEQNGLLLAVSIKTITSAPYGKNLKNRFSDLCSEAITLHMRFPYSVVCMLFAFPSAADEDVTPARTTSTFRRATKLLATIGGREEYTDPGEKFENITMMLFQPVVESGPTPWVRLVEANTRRELSEREYFLLLREIYNTRNPHAAIGETDLGDDDQ